MLKLQINGEPVDKQADHKSKWTIIVGVLVALGTIGLCIHWQYTHSPKYALAEAHAAMVQHDFERFERFVDLDSFCEGLVNDTLELVTSETNGKKHDASEQFANSFVGGLMGFMRPQLIAVLKSGVRSAIETGDPEALRKQRNNYWGELLPPSRTSRLEIEELGTEGKLAFVRVTLTADSGSPQRFHFDFKLRQRNGYWQIIGLTNARQLMEQGRHSPR